MADEGKALLKTTSLVNCNTLAASIAALGGSVSVVQGEFDVMIEFIYCWLAPPTSSDEKGIPNRNKKKLQRKSNPVIWTSGRVAQSLASEYIYVLRQLLDPKRSSSSWTECVKTILYRALAELPSLLSSGNVSQEQTRKPLAALSVLGGYTETIRIGGKAIISETGLCWFSVEILTFVVKEFKRLELLLICWLVEVQLKWYLIVTLQRQHTK